MALASWPFPPQPFPALLMPWCHCPHCELFTTGVCLFTHLGLDCCNGFLSLSLLWHYDKCPHLDDIKNRSPASPLSVLRARYLEQAMCTPVKAHGSTSLSSLCLWPFSFSIVTLSCFCHHMHFWVLNSFSVTSENTGPWVSTVGLVLSAAKVEGAMPKS